MGKQLPTPLGADADGVGLRSLDPSALTATIAAEGVSGVPRVAVWRLAEVETSVGSTPASRCIHSASGSRLRRGTTYTQKVRSGPE